MKKVTLTISTNNQISHDIFLMELTGDVSVIKNPGEFIAIKLPNFYLRRPFSICDFEKQNLRILYKVLGHGTKAMSLFKPTTQLDVLIGLGNGFNIEQSVRPLLIGGGIGVAPLLKLAKNFQQLKITPTLIYGASTKNELAYHEEYAKYCNVVLCTDDGSYGFKGNPIQYLEQNKVDYDNYFACGPIKMLQALQKHDPNGWISLESRMGCGFGACMGCSIKTTSLKYQRICVEGPVFKASEVKF